MKAVLEVVKRYLFEIICGAVGVAGVVLIFLGLGAMEDVTTQMQEAKQVKDSLELLARKPKPINEKSIEFEKSRIDTIKSDYDKAITFAAKINQYPLLIDGVFPSPTIEQKKEFQKRYRQQVSSWIDQLTAGTPPNEDDIVVEKEKVEAEMREQGLLDDEDGRGQQAAAGIDEEAKVRASIKRAQSIRLYASELSFQDSAVSVEGGPMYQVIPPGEEQMWYAQLELWVQQQIVEAISRINERAANDLSGAGERVWVGSLPIKEIISVQVSQYYLIDGKETSNQPGNRAQGNPGGRGGRGGRGGGAAKVQRAFPPADWNNVFTQNKSTDLYELLQFSVRAVIDSRDLPAVLAGLCEESFSTPLSVSYRDIEPNTSMTGKIYGDEPVVELTVDFETVMFSDLYLEIMPDPILELVNKKRPEKKEEGA